jgi:hypothetical protein
MNGAPFLLELSSQLEQLLLNIWMLYGEMADFREDPRSVIPVIFASEPSGRFGAEEDAGEN